MLTFSKVECFLGVDDSVAGTTPEALLVEKLLIVNDPVVRDDIMTGGTNPEYWDDLIIEIYCKITKYIFLVALYAVYQKGAHHILILPP